MQKYILVITSSIDITVDYIIKKFDSLLFFRLNIDELSNYSINVGIKELAWTIENLTTKVKISKIDTLSIYYRKPIFPDLSEYNPCYHSMIEKDIIALITGITDSFDGKVLSKPSLLRLAENKVNQLLFATEHNFHIPNSFIGNSNDSQKEYSNVTSIIKPITTGKVYTEENCELYQTNYFKYDNDDIKLTPIYLQNYISKQFEVRITIINNFFFPVRIDTIDKLDWRKDYENHKYSLVELPEKVKHECKMMLANYNLVFGAFDYIVTPNNNWVFLELNPNGQWLWLEEALNLDISNKIIEYLQGD